MNLWFPQATPDLLTDDALLDALIAPFPAVRFMDWQQTNGSTARSLADMRKRYAYAGGAWSPDDRMSLDTCIAVANRNCKRGWYCIPHLVEHISEVVDYICERSDVRPILEWSNEVWNAQFSQNAYARQQSQAPSAYRPELDTLARMTAALYDAAAGRADVVAGLQFWARDVCEQFMPLVAGKLDAIALAPYVGRTVQGDFADQVAREIYSDVAPAVAWYSAFADVALYAYEGGWHGHAMSAQVETAMCQYIRSESAAHNTRELWRVWRANGGGLACPYALAASHGRQQWGHVEIVNGSYEILPRYYAAEACYG